MTLAGAQRSTRIPGKRQGAGPATVSPLLHLDPSIEMRQHRGMEGETDLVAVARAYFAVLNGGGRNYEAYMAAMKVYLKRRPRKQLTLRLGGMFPR